VLAGGFGAAPSRVACRKEGIAGEWQAPGEYRASQRK
jgi:hypothetical protein